MVVDGDGTVAGAGPLVGEGMALEAELVVGAGTAEVVGLVVGRAKVDDADVLVGVCSGVVVGAGAVVAVFAGDNT